MKKIFFLFALLASITASAAVTVTPLSVDYSAQKVTFSVSWPDDAAVDRVWVWIDLSPITGTSPGTFEKAVISGATTTVGSIETVSGNTRGFYVTTSPSTVTATLDNAAGKFNWCVYGSDAPPKVTAENGTYTLVGTPPFILTAAGGTATQTVEATSIATSAVTVTPVTLTDQTGCPGVFCIYTGSDLFIDADHLCQTRATGAENWEAWIKDTRDSELYRIVLMPDDKWWLAQNVKLASYNSATVGTAISDCTTDECGRWYTPTVTSSGYGGTTTGFGANVQGVCPEGWILPIMSTWQALVTALFNATQVNGHKYLTSANCTCDYDNSYGWSGTRCLHRTGDVVNGNTYHTNDADHRLYRVCEQNGAYGGNMMDEVRYPDGHVVRCFRQL